ncbi:hypothetical protein B30_01360 [Celeribacter baekdonensis B30]|uniref:Uncharacterized protein n=1 Tax=Celeribacter baekdonensis B30 TaxID=1208323 RepID=K2JIN5_9RHOB|nr:hypothetical protein B30_01360 [Celeribacter baekdonensis B30]
MVVLPLLGVSDGVDLAHMVVFQTPYLSSLMILKNAAVAPMVLMKWVDWKRINGSVAMRPSLEASPIK